MFTYMFPNFDNEKIMINEENKLLLLLFLGFWRS